MNNQILDDELTKEQKEVVYASFTKRLSAAIIDTLILIPFILLSYYNMFSIKSYPLAVLATFGFAFYQPFMETQYQATIGKMIMKIKVLTEDFKRADLGTIIVRNSLYLISAALSASSMWFLYQNPEFVEIDSWAEFASFVGNQKENSIEGMFTWVTFFSCLMVAYTRKNQALHDKMAKTVVILTEV
ncbi:MAG: RDD family protein [Saprospiraceae bacterium]